MVTSDNGSAARDGGAADAVLDIAFAFWQATLLLSADELGVFAALRDGPVDASTVRARLGLDPETTDDFLAALAALGLIEECTGGYRNSAASARFLDPNAPDYLGVWLAMARAAQRETTALTGRLRGATRPETRDADRGGRMMCSTEGSLGALRAPITRHSRRIPAVSTKDVLSHHERGDDADPLAR